MMKKLGLILLFALLTIQVAQAQEATPSADGALFTFTFETHNFEVFFPVTLWQPDSQSFYFQSMSGGNLDNAPFFQYFPASNQLTSLALPPDEIELSVEQMEMLGIGLGTAHVSPNGRYAVYQTMERPCPDSNTCQPLLGLVDLETNAHTILRKPGNHGNFIYWSADSSALLITDIDEGAMGAVWYIDVAPALASPDGYQPRALMNFPFGEAGFVDISRDGRRVLVRDQGNGRGTGRGLFLWDSRSPDTGDQFAAFADGRDVLKDDIVAGASFIPGDDQHLLVVVREGLARYDLATGQLDVLNPAINAHWVIWAYFSPDARYVLTYAQLENGSDWQGQIVLYTVES